MADEDGLTTVDTAAGLLDATARPSDPSRANGRLRPGRRITGMSAVLLPFRAGGAIDWPGFEAHVARTASAGLVPAVNMDTGYVHLLDGATRTEALERTRSVLGGGTFVAGAFDGRDAVAVAEHGGTPIVVPSDALADDVLDAYGRIAEVVDRFLGFELSPVFNPAGRIWSLDTYRAVLDLPRCVGAKHSSLRRQPEWDRLALRDEHRPDFMVLTGNDLAIDMVMYGSDYLLGLSTFAPDRFAERDRLWAVGDPGFHELNDALQHLGNLAFRPPIPAYRHDAALFLKLRGWLGSDTTPPGVPRRPDWEIDLLAEAADRLGLR
jgi:dihydrodipicolinate synthase/N-acetylneuraminate lyase